MADFIDLRSRLGAVLDQGERSTCLAFAATAAHEVALFPDHNVLDACEEYLYWAAKQYDGPIPGTTFQAIRHGLANEGQPLEQAWPYDPERDDLACDYAPPATAHSCEPRWNPGFEPVEATLEGIRSELENDRVVVLGMPTWAAFDTPVAGRLTVPGPADLDGDAHAVAIVAFDEATSSVCLRNSWGAAWGSNGEAWLPTSFLTNHACLAWTITNATPPPGATSGPAGPMATSRRFGEAATSPRHRNPAL